MRCNGDDYTGRSNIKFFKKFYYICYNYTSSSHREVNAADHLFIHSNEDVAFSRRVNDIYVAVREIHFLIVPICFLIDH